MRNAGAARRNRFAASKKHFRGECMSAIVSGAARRRRARIHRLALRLGIPVAGLIAATAWAAPGAARLQGEVIANGGTSHSVGGDYRLAGSIAQPVAGPASGDAHRLHSGFWQPALGAPADPIFRNGFED
jgi:hypothetical protein